VSSATYEQARLLTFAASLGSFGVSPFSKKRRIEKIQLFVFTSQTSITPCVFSMLGLDSVSWIRDWFLPFFPLVLANLERILLLHYVRGEHVALLLF
jgi:hypothetical protein